MFWLWSDCIDTGLTAISYVIDTNRTTRTNTDKNTHTYTDTNARMYTSAHSNTYTHACTYEQSSARTRAQNTKQFDLTKLLVCITGGEGM